MVAQVETISVGKNAFEKAGGFLIRYGLVVVLGWIGAMKFTAYLLRSNCRGGPQSLRDWHAAFACSSNAGILIPTLPWISR